MAEYIYGPILPHFQGKAVLHKVNRVEPIIVPNVPKGILDRYKKVYLCCDLIYINCTGLLNTISRHSMFVTGIMIKNRKLKNIKDEIKQVNKIYLQRDFSITHIHANS